MKIIAIGNQKGGTAKTTTAAVLGMLLSRHGYQVHLVDMDPQASLSRAFGHTDANDRLYVSLQDRAGLPIDNIANNLTLSPSSIELSRIETELLAESGREYYLRSSLERTELPGDAIVLLDCPPSLGILAVNCLASAGGLIIVVQPGGFELHALAHLDMTVSAIQSRINPSLTLMGAIITNCHRRRMITQQVEDEIAQYHDVLGSIRADARLLYATTAGALPRLTRSNALDDYARVVERLRTLISWPEKHSAA